MWKLEKNLSKIILNKKVVNAEAKCELKSKNQDS